MKFCRWYCRHILWLRNLNFKPNVLRRSGTGNFADKIKFGTNVIRKTFKNPRTFKRVTKHVLKCNFYLSFPVYWKLLIFGNKFWQGQVKNSAEFKGCHRCFFFFFEYTLPSFIIVKYIYKEFSLDWGGIGVLSHLPLTPSLSING